MGQVVGLAVAAATQTQESASRWDHATPFLIGICLLLITVGTTKAIVKKAEAGIREEWTPVNQKKKAKTHLLPMAWVVDVAQIPVLLGTPLVGLFILQHHINGLSFTAVMSVGIIAFMVVFSTDEINDYSRFDIKVGPLTVGIITLGGILVNLVCAVIAFVE
jgi:hypothetical protein